MESAVNESWGVLRPEGVTPASQPATGPLELIEKNKFVTAGPISRIPPVSQFFLSPTKDGMYPWATLVLDAAGNLYGTTTGGGEYGYGAVFEITPQH